MYGKSGISIEKKSLVVSGTVFCIVLSCLCHFLFPREQNIEGGKRMRINIPFLLSRLKKTFFCVLVWHTNKKKCPSCACKRVLPKCNDYLHFLVTP